MKYLIVIFLFVSTTYAQEISAPILIHADEFIGVDNVANIYYIKNNTLFKQSKENLRSYSNIHLGQIAHIDIINPLKIVVFYKDFNSVVLLDNELNELTNTINFNTTISKNISFTGTVTNTNLWLFNEDDNSLQIWNYKVAKPTITIPLQNDFTYRLACSNYQYIWLISNNKALQFNEYGSFIKDFNIPNIKKAIVYKNGIICQIDKQLFYFNENQEPTIIKIQGNFEIVDFYIQNDWLYFFNGKSINKINLPKN